MTILKEENNCWCISHADRVAFLIDGAAYFESLAEAIEKAKKNIFIASWDIDSRIQLSQRNGSATHRQCFGDFLNAKAKGTPGLQVYVLNWDFPMLYVREREWMPVLNLGWKTHRRIHYHLDDEHPLGASQHQKFVVIDNRIAFCGGMDLSNSRWDTPEHLVNDSRRINSDNELYGPLHDIQMLVDGDAAESLSELFRVRWEWATGNRILVEKDNSNDPWPKKITPDLRDIQVAISRTLPAYKGRQEVREVEKLYKDSIASAKKTIYIENQYLTSSVIAEKVSNSLLQKEGPEIIVVLPEKSSGWLEQSTMDSLRARIIANLFKSDQYNRLRIFYPVLDDGKTALYIHSKIMIVDDQLILVGSANLSNRSMGFDSECTLAIEAKDDSKICKAIACLRNRLFAEHLGISEEKVNEAFSDQTSFIKSVESLSASPGRRLKNLDYSCSLPIDGISIVQNNTMLDPETPVEFDRMMDQYIEGEKKPTRMLRLVKISCILIFLFALASFWRWGPFFELTAGGDLVSWAHKISDHPLAFAAIVLAYVFGGLIMVPVTLLIGITAMVYTPVLGALCAWTGCLFSALTTFLLGSKLGKQTVRKVAGKRLNRLSRHIAKQGILSVVIIRNIPIAPFTIVNIIAGASHIKFKDFLIGTALGMLPGILMITIFTDRLVETIENPGWFNTLIAAALGGVMILGNWWTAKRLTRRNRS